jgi:hypothetical protein
MSSERYIEIDSSYRNRKLWPLASDFDVILSQTGRANIDYAQDPVSNAAPIIAWTSNRFTANAPNNTIVVTADLFTTSLGFTSDRTTFIITGTAGQLQEQLGYYNNAIITNTSHIPLQEKRILSYEYIGNNKGIVTVSSAFSILNNGDSLSIRDATNLTSLTNPWFYVPASNAYARASSQSAQGGDNKYYGILLYNETRNEYRVINDFNAITHLLTTTTPIPGTWTVTDNYTIRKEPPVLVSAVGAVTLNSVVLTAGNNINDFYRNSFIRVRPAVYGNSITAPEGETRQITNYDGTTQVATVFPPFSGLIGGGATVEILQFSYDNFNPLVYTGSTVSQQEMVCYEVELVSLILPNWTLKSIFGSRIAYYPYVYVEFTNLSSSRAGLNNVLYSNNPNATKVLFRAPIDDIQNPSNTSFVKLDGDGAVQTIKFKPNDNFHFSVTLPNGDLFETVLPENYSPFAPNSISQISALFGIKRV